MNFWLFRVGLVIFNSYAQRAIWSETWLTTDPPIPPNHDTWTSFALYPMGDRLKLMFAGAFTYSARHFIEEIWPSQRFVNSQVTTPSPLDSYINPYAPECAFRLQRVGATGRRGRMTPPILYDDWYTDFPTRRHIDVATLAPIIAANVGNWQQQVTDFHNRTYHNVIFHRRSFTWDNVIGYSLLPNPIRVWRRWRPTYYPFPPPSLHWVPDEIDPIH